MPAGPAGSLPSSSELEAAWPTVLGTLKPGTKAVYLTGRFAASAGGAVVYALANAPTRDHCEKKRPEVEAALAAHFGRPVPLRLATDAEVGGAQPVSAPTPAPAATPDDDHVDDVHALEDAPTATTGVERLAEAFPGAELVEEP